MRHRDFIRVGDYYFSVVGYNHSRDVRCILRYIPDENGDRSKNGKRFRKVSHEEALNYFKQFQADGLHYIPKHMIEEIYKPDERLKEICRYDESVRIVADFFKLPKMGVTGSRLIGLAKANSDVDFVLYDECFEIGRKVIKEGLEKGVLDEPDLEYVYRKRKVNLPFEVFAVHEKRKFNKARINGINFDILYVNSKGQDFQRGVKLNKATVVARVLKANPFDFPAVYYVDSCVDAIVCFTHTFVGQAFEGEIVEAKGWIELVNGKKYLVVGSRRETADEYIVSLSLLENENVIDEFLNWKRG
jgi:predicted nucleotidyltransferase